LTRSIKVARSSSANIAARVKKALPNGVTARSLGAHPIHDAERSMPPQADRLASPRRPTRWPLLGSLNHPSR
jgi:hypothetical protein